MHEGAWQSESTNLYFELNAGVDNGKKPTIKMLTQSNLAGVKSTMSSTADGKVYNFRGINQSWPDDDTRWKGRGINARILWHWQLHSCWDTVEFALTVFLTLYYVVAKYLVSLWGEQSHLWAFGLDLCNLLIISCLSAHFRSLKKE